MNLHNAHDEKNLQFKFQVKSYANRSPDSLKQIDSNLIFHIHFFPLSLLILYHNIRCLKPFTHIKILWKVKPPNGGKRTFSKIFEHQYFWRYFAMRFFVFNVKNTSFLHQRRMSENRIWKWREKRKTKANQNLHPS